MAGPSSNCARTSPCLSTTTLLIDCGILTCERASTRAESERNLGSERYCFGNSPSLTSPSYRSEEHTSELQSLMRISYAVFCLKKKNKKKEIIKSYKDI